MNFTSFAAFDAGVADVLRHVASPALTKVFWMATLVGDASVMTTLSVAAALLLVAWGRRRYAVVLAALMVADPLIASALKVAFARPRPPAAAMLISLPSDAAFPSGHAMASGLYFGLLALFALRETVSARRGAAIVVGALAGVLLVGISRVYLGVHWPSDVVASWVVVTALIALGWAALALWERLRGPEPLPVPTPGRRRRLTTLAWVCAVVLIAIVARQAGINPLL